MIKLLPPSNDLLAAIVQDMEEADVAELESSAGHSDLQLILEDSRDVSFESYVVTIDGDPVAVFGICMDNPDDGTAGVPWAVFTKTLRTHPKVLLRVSRAILARWQAMFAYLVNTVDQRNTRAIRWLKSMGFTMGESVPSAGGHPFYLFEMHNV